MDESTVSGMQVINHLFDKQTFFELGSEICRENTQNRDGMICGYGAIHGRLVFAFSQDYNRMAGAFDRNGCAKIQRMYELALKAQAPVIGVFSSAGSFVCDGASVLTEYAKLFSVINGAKGKITQYALINGPVSGPALCAASMFDFVLSFGEASDPYVNAGRDCAVGDGLFYSIHTDSVTLATTAFYNLFDIMPANTRESGNQSAVDTADCDDPNADFAVSGMTGIDLARALADRSRFSELYGHVAPEIKVGIGRVAGILCGIIASDKNENRGMLTALCCEKIKAVMSVCKRYHLPVVTLVDTEGVDFGDTAQNGASAVKPFSDVAEAYLTADMPKVTVIVGKAFGTAAAVLGCMSVGSDVYMALTDARISAYRPETAVAFIGNDRITETRTRETVEAEWLDENGDPIKLARNGDVDIVIPESELKARIASTLFMLTANRE